MNQKKLWTYISTLKNTPELYRAVEQQCEADTLTIEQKIYSAVFVPTVIGFVEWVLQQAQQKGICRLYFLARDGYQFYLVAEIICRQCKIPVECIYLKGSRYAWRVPEYHLDLDGALEKICIGGIHVTLYKMLKRAALTDEEIQQVANEIGMENSIHATMTYAEVKGLQPIFTECKLLTSYIVKHSQAAYETTMEYLRQEGLFDDISYALVDSGWVGSLQVTLGNLMKSANDQREIEGFYFGLYELPQGVNADQYHTYYFQPKGDIRRKARFSNCLFESVFSAPEGMTLAYERQANGEIDVVSETKENPNAKRIEENAVLLQQMVEELYKSKTSVPVTCKQVDQLLSQLMQKPDQQEAESYGSYWFSDDVQATSLQPVAVELTAEEIKNQHIINKMLVMMGIKRGELKNSAWIEGSIARSDVNQRRNLLHAYWYKILIYIRKQFAAHNK